MFGINYKELQNKRFSVRLGVFLLFLFIVIVLLILKSMSMATSIITDQLFLSLTIMIVTCVFYYLVIKQLLKLYRNLSKDTKKSSRKRRVYLTLAALILMLAFHIILAMMMHQKPEVNMNAPNLAPLSIIYMGVFYILLSPIVEELLMRGVFLNLFFIKTSEGNNKINASESQTKVFNILLAIIINSYIFTALHGASDNIAIINYMFNGIIASVLYLLTRDIKTAIVYHSINNTIAFIPILIALL